MKKGKARDELFLQKEITFTDLLCMGDININIMYRKGEDVSFSCDRPFTILL